MTDGEGTSRTVVVVGAGILGLAAAEALSRRGASVIVLRSSSWPPASSAAAANLATKAQRFGRDPHYALKLEAKENYEQWLARAGVDARVFQRGAGLDFFTSEHETDAHFRRVKQPAEEIAARGLAPQETVRMSWNAVRHEGEATVDAPALLYALEATCRARGVIFAEQTVSTHDDLFRIHREPSMILLCTGAGTPELLAALHMTPREDAGAALARRRLAASRFTVGSTFRATSPLSLPCSDTAALAAPVAPVGLISLLPDSHVVAGAGNDFHHEARGAVLVDFSRGRHTVTLSAQGGVLNVSSSSVRVRAASERSDEECARWRAEDESIVSLLPPGTVAKLGLEARGGVRVGFGAGELLVCELKREPQCGPRVYLCAGAHKSGFLFAPAVEQLLHGVGAL